MDASVSTITAWTLVQEIPIPADVTNLLVEGEQAVAAYKTFRDSAIFTTKRLIVRDAQGLTGKKIEIYSLPYSSINMWSSENAGGMLDRDAELELWTRAGHIKVKLHKTIDVRRLDQLISWAVLKWTEAASFRRYRSGFSLAHASTVLSRSTKGFLILNHPVALRRSRHSLH